MCGMAYVMSMSILVSIDRVVVSEEYRQSSGGLVNWIGKSTLTDVYCIMISRDISIGIRGGLLLNHIVDIETDSVCCMRWSGYISFNVV